MGVVEELQVFPFHLDSEVVGWFFANTPYYYFSCTMIVDVFFRLNIHLFARGMVYSTPYQEVEVEITLAEQHVAMSLTVVAVSTFYLNAVNVSSLLGDEIDYRRESHAAIKRRSWSAQHLYLLQLFKRDAEVGSGDIGGIAVQPVTVEHDENLLLTVAVDAAHGDIDVIVAIDDMHARHIGCQHFLQVAATAVANHLLRNQYGRHRYLVQRLRLAGSCRDGCRSS